MARNFSQFENPVSPVSPISPVSVENKSEKQGFESEAKLSHKSQIK
jgi:hypothetical protein